MAPPPLQALHQAQTTLTCQARGASELDQPLLNLPLSQWLFFFGIALLVIEIAFFGFATFVLFFVAIAMLATGGLMALGLLPELVNIAIITVSLLSIGTALVLWKPLKKMQSPENEDDIEVGFVGHRFQLEADIAPDKPGRYTYSGIVWAVVSDSPIPKATKVKVVHADVGQLQVMPIENS